MTDLVYVCIKNTERYVKCPICGEVIDLQNVEDTACPHLDDEDYITPEGREYINVWFKKEVD